MEPTSEKKMRYRYLGNTGLKVSELCLGTMTFGLHTSEEESFKIMDAFRARGGNFLDTANVYANGASEEIIGRWLKDKPREEFVIATKVRFNANMFLGQPVPVNETGLSRSHILNAVEKSLKRLQTDYIDLYQIHCWDEGTPLEEVLTTLNDLVRAGKVRYIGCSNLKGWQLQKAIDISKYLKLERFISLQPQYSLLERYIELELLDVCKNEGVAVLPWSPLAGGILSLKYGHEKREENPTEGRYSQPFFNQLYSRYASKDKTWETLKTVKKISDETKRSAAEVSVNWVLQAPLITSPLIGAKSVEQLEENLKVLEWKLTKEQWEELERVSKPESPYDAIANYNKDRVRD